MTDRADREARIERERHRLTTHANATALRLELARMAPNPNPIRTARAQGRANIAAHELAEFEARHPTRTPGTITTPHRRDIDGPPEP